MELVFLSDTHGRHEEFELGSGDVLVHSGDAELVTDKCLEEFAVWMSLQDFKYKIFVPGNHDTFIETNTDLCREIFEDYGINMLIDEGIEIDGHLFWGSPYTPTFGYWSFMKDPSDLIPHWQKIPNDVSVLITHGPPQYLLDYTSRYNAGCQFLSQYVIQKKPIIHAFGHIHESYGFKEFNDIIFVNAAVAPSLYDSEEKDPWRVFIEDGKVDDIIKASR